MQKRKLLLPFAALYGLGARLRNLMYNIGFKSSTSFPIPIICIGNLSVGGTGKSPMTMYLIELLKDQIMVCTLSRGYGRKTKGFKLANYSSTALDIGDEPLQFFNRYKNSIMVTVGEDRVSAAKIILNELKGELILLDDAFQHRKIKAGFNVLLTAFDDLYASDYLLPAGGLREPKTAAKRANIIVVTKCPHDLDEHKKSSIKETLNVNNNQSVYFSSIIYKNKIFGIKGQTITKEHFKDLNVVLVTGIAKSENLVEEVKEQFKSVKHLKFSDHHNYTNKDIDKLLNAFFKLEEQRIILTTEKDFMRLKDKKEFKDYLYYLPITVNIDKQEKFNQEILDYVRKHS